MWRRWAVPLGLLAGLLAGCHDGSPRRAAPSTTGPGGAPSTTASTAPAAGSGVVGAWFSDDRNGWAIGEEPCPRPGFDLATCAVVSRTTDAGAAWTRLSQLEVPGPEGAGGPDYVRDVRFADPQHGWVYHRGLSATFNGGKRWQRVDLGNPVVALEAVAGQAYALVGACGNGAGNCVGPMRIAEGTVATGRWRFATLGFDLPFTDAGTLIVNRSAVYALVSRSGTDQILLARAGAGRWERRTAPCPRAIVEPITGADGLVAACLPAMPGGSVELQTSSDGGRSWAVVWQSTFAGPVASLAVTGESAVVGLANGDVVRTTDNGMNFSTVLRSGANPAVRFSDAANGIVTAGPGSTRRLFRSTDKGATWQPLNTP